MSPPLVPRLNQEIHFVLCAFGKHGQAYVETDPGQADRQTVIRNFIAGEFDHPISVLQSGRGLGSRRFRKYRTRDYAG
jgi:hypothetical protein